MPAATTRSERLSMRLSPQSLKTIRDAAAAQGQDVTSFVLGAAIERARDVLLRERVLHLAPREIEQVETALTAEPRVIPELAALIAATRQSHPEFLTREPSTR